AVFVNRRNNRQERLAEHRRVVDQVLARLEPAGHEVVLPDDLLLPAPPADSAPDPDTAVAVEALANPETAEASVLEGLWAREALAVGNETKITEYRQMPLEMRISGEQELLEGAVRAAAREAAEDPDPETFAVKRQNLAELVESLRPYRIAEASTRLAREVSMRAVDTPIGPVIVTELGERILDAAPALRKEAPLSESIAELQQVAEEAAHKTELLEELYAKLPDSPSRPAVAAALADLGADPDEATRRYNAVLETLRRSSTPLLQDGIDLPSLAAFLVMNNDEDDIDEFIESYEEARRLRVDPPTAVEMALAGLRGKREMEDIRAEADRLGIPVSIAAALSRAGYRATATYRELVDELAEVDVASADVRTIAAVLALSLEPSQAMRRWREARAALADLGLTGSYADVAAAFGASDPRGPREFALAYAAQRQELARSSVKDAERFAPELAHAGTSGQRDTWTGEPIPGGMRHFDPFFLFYYHWIMTSTMTHSLGWREVYRDRS